MYLRKLKFSGNIWPGFRYETKTKTLEAIQLIERFLESDAELAEITQWEGEYSSLKKVRDVFSQAIKRAEFEDRVICSNLKGVLYLIRI